MSNKNLNLENYYRKVDKCNLMNLLYKVMSCLGWSLERSLLLFKAIVIYIEIETSMRIIFSLIYQVFLSLKYRI